MKTILISVFIAVVSLSTQAHAQCGCRHITTKQINCCGQYKGIQTCAGPTGNCNTCNSCAQQIMCCSDNLCSAGLGGSCSSSVTSLNGGNSVLLASGTNGCAGASKATLQTSPAARGVLPGKADPKTTGPAEDSRKASASTAPQGGGAQ